MKKKLSILSLSLVTGAATSITTIIPLIVTAYPQKSLTSIETLITISSLSALLTILLNEKIVNKIGLKQTILSGLLIGAIAGIMPFFLTSYNLFLVSRVLLGLGIGLYSPHAIALISLFFEGSERNTLLGMQMGIGALGNAILLMLSSSLATISWKYTFLVYLFLLFIFVLILLFVPNKQVFQNKEELVTGNIQSSIIKYLVLCFVTFVIIWGVQLKIPSYLMEQGILDTKKAGLVLSSMNIAGMVAGFSFGILYKRINVFLLPTGFLLAGLSVSGMILSSNWVAIFSFAVLFNFVYSFTGPTIVLQVNQLATKNQLTKVNSWLMMCTILSSYAAPFIWNSFSITSATIGETKFSLILMALSLLIIGLVLSIYFMKLKKVHRR